MLSWDKVAQSGMGALVNWNLNIFHQGTDSFKE